MRILIVHQHYLSAGQPGGSRFNELARLWSESGHEVTVIAGSLNYNTGRTPDYLRGRWVVEEHDQAVRVLRCHVPSSYTRGYLGRMWSFFGFTVSSTTAALRVPSPDVVIGTSPPLIVAIPAWVAARRARAALVFEIRDLWPESAVTTGVLKEKAPLTRALYALERWACHSADLINVLTPAFRDDLVRRGLAPASKISFIPNGADVARFAPGSRINNARRSLGWGERIVVMYAGAHGRANALDQLVEAAALLKDRRDILIACVGDGPERVRLESEVARRGLQDSIIFHGPQPKENMPDIVNACDIGAAVLQKNPTFRTVYPNKVFDYMACERPTLLAIDGVARELVCNEAKAGIFAEPENPGELAGAIKHLADDPSLRHELGRAGRQWVLAHATREALASRYLDALTGIIADHPKHTAQRGWRLALKTLVDRGAAAAALVATAPILLSSMAAVRTTMGSPTLFAQERPGRDGRGFKLFKLRTMRAARDGQGNPLPDERRLTALGRFLRSTSLDELPQLWNVLRGDLSLVGPRPLLMQYLPRYAPEQARRHDVMPGITGWAQINGRNALSWDEKFALDTWYVDHWSLLLDMKILAKTLLSVVRRQGISSQGHATMPEFMGTGSKDG
jgi:lipopolysaccharide/colanic/teichoic acid biosynthesis glycosyltransferase